MPWFHRRASLLLSWQYRIPNKVAEEAHGHQDDDRNGGDQQTVLHDVPAMLSQDELLQVVHGHVPPVLPTPRRSAYDASGECDDVLVPTVRDEGDCQSRAGGVMLPASMGGGGRTRSTGLTVSASARRRTVSGAAPEPCSNKMDDAGAEVGLKSGLDLLEQLVVLEQSIQSGQHRLEAQFERRHQREQVDRRVPVS